MPSPTPLPLKQRFFRNVSFKTLADFISRLATFFVTVFLTRRLSQEGFGLFSYTLALAGTWALVLDFGWNNVLIRRAKEPGFSGLLMSVFVLKTVIFGLSAILVFLFPALLPHKVTAPLFIFCFFYAASLSYQDYQSAAIAGMERFDLEWIFKIVPRWVPFFILFFFLASDPSLESVAMFLGVSALAITFIMIAFMIRKFFRTESRISLEILKSILKQGAPFGLAALIWGVYTKLDLILLGIYGFPLNEVGIYAAAIKLVEFSRGLSMILYVAMIPIFNDHQNNPDKLWSLVKRISWGFVGLSVVAAPLIFLTSPFVMKLIYGTDYIYGGKPLAVALMGILLFLINTPFLAAMVSLGKGKLALLGSGLMLATCFAVNIFFIPSKGLMAPAWAIVAAEAMWLSFHVFFLSSRLGHKKARPS